MKKLFFLAAIAFVTALASCGHKSIVKYRDVSSGDSFSRTEDAKDMAQGDTVTFTSTSSAVIDSIVPYVDRTVIVTFKKADGTTYAEEQPYAAQALDDKVVYYDDEVGTIVRIENVN